jgi:hypothetical protein
MLKKLFSIGGFLGANLALAMALTLTYLVGLIPGCPTWLLWVIGVPCFLFTTAVGSVVLSGLLAGEGVFVALSGKVSGKAVAGALVVTTFAVGIVWAVLGLLAKMHGLELGYVLTVIGVYNFLVSSFVFSGFSAGGALLGGLLSNRKNGLF